MHFANEMGCKKNETSCFLAAADGAETGKEEEES